MPIVLYAQVWDPAVEKQLSILDDSTHSRMLISTRIRGLVADAVEVQVELLTNQEAVEMLCEQSQLDRDDTIPVEVFSIVQFCGNLPLCICVAAGMIRANKADSNALESVREVLAMLQDDKAGALDEESEISVADLVVGRSVRCLTNDASTLFELFGK